MDKINFSDNFNIQGKKIILNDFNVPSKIKKLYNITSITLLHKLVKKSKNNNNKSSSWLKERRSFFLNG